MLAAAVLLLGFGNVGPESVIGVSRVTPVLLQPSLAGSNLGEQGVQVLAGSAETDEQMWVSLPPLPEKLRGVFMADRRQTVISRTRQRHDGPAAGVDQEFLLDILRNFLHLGRGERLRGDKKLAKVKIRSRVANGQRSTSVRRHPPKHGLARRVVPRENHRFHPKAGHDLGQLAVRAHHVDHPAEPGAGAKTLFVPAQPENSHLHERFSARQAHARLQEEPIAQFDSPLADSLLELRDAIRAELKERDQVRHLRQGKAIVRIACHPV